MKNWSRRDEGPLHRYRSRTLIISKGHKDDKSGSNEFFFGFMSIEAGSNYYYGHETTPGNGLNL